MYQLLETIKCTDGKLCNIELHQSRLETAQREYIGIEPLINLFEKIEIPEFAKSGLFRCRVTYSKQIDKIEFIPYQYREIKSLKLVVSNDIEYYFKYANREKLNQLFEKRDNCDDIIIVKNGCVTDSFAANLIFFDGRNWITPDTPLLAGTQRAKYLKEGKISERRIYMEDLPKFEKVALINALNDWGEMPVISIDKLFV